MKVFTIADLADAIEKDGLTQIKQWHFRASVSPIGVNYSTSIQGNLIGACAIGQACVNIGVVPPNQYGDWASYPRGDYPRDDVINNVIGSITGMNDSDRHTFKTIAKQLRIRNADRLDYQIEAAEYDYTPYLKKNYEQNKSEGPTSVRL